MRVLTAGLIAWLLPGNDYRLYDILDEAYRSGLPVAPAEEAVRCALFLASDAARRVTGAIIPVDAGWTAA